MMLLLLDICTFFTLYWNKAWLCLVTRVEKNANNTGLLPCKNSIARALNILSCHLNYQLTIFDLLWSKFLKTCLKRSILLFHKLIFLSAPTLFSLLLRLFPSDPKMMLHLTLFVNIQLSYKYVFLSISFSLIKLT
jgi:hypothetical protein